MSMVVRGLALGVLCCVAFASVGCVKLKQAITVMPDGSGKIELRYGLSSEQIKMARESDVDPFREVMPDVMQHKCGGLVAFTEPKTEEGAGYTYLTYTAYFKDINTIRIGGLGEGKPACYTFTREGQGATLTVTGGTALSMLKRYEPTPEHEREQSRKAMAGMALSEHFVLPGNIEAVKGLSTKDNTAMLDLTLDHLVDGTGPVEQLKGADALKLTVPKVEIDDAKDAAFQAEMQKALEAWKAKQEAQDK